MRRCPARHGVDLAVAVLELDPADLERAQIFRVGVVEAPSRTHEGEYTSAAVVVGLGQFRACALLRRGATQRACARADLDAQPRPFPRGLKPGKSAPGLAENDSIVRICLLISHR